MLYIIKENPGIDDAIILQKANSENRILITQDKDFDELVYRLHQIHSEVILIRLEGLKPETKVQLVWKAISEHTTEFLNAFAVIHKGVVKIRRMP